MLEAISIATLLYGDHRTLAARCLESISVAVQFGRKYVQDVRIGLNDPCDGTRLYACKWADSMQRRWELPVLVYEASPPQNVYKYPLMRRMFYTGPDLPEFVLWLDDDSFIWSHPSWWGSFMGDIKDADLAGQHWYMQLHGRQWDWIKTQPWYNPQVEKPKKGMLFCQGGWWVGRTSFLRKHNWPIPELRHNGGDSMLGELCRHQAARMIKLDDGVYSNIGPDGRQSSSPRRGYSEKNIGVQYAGKPLSTEHQDFECKIIMPAVSPR